MLPFSTSTSRSAMVLLEASVLSSPCVMPPAYQPRLQPQSASGSTTENPYVKQTTSRVEASNSLGFLVAL